MLRKIAYRLPWLVSVYHFLWALAGALLYRFPSKQLYVIGVTGTKGKTTVLELMNAILETAGKKTALLSSLKVKISDHLKKNTSENTMPGRFAIQRFLRRAVRAGCRYALLEVTSQGVSQSRHRFINWNAAFLINLHPEHIEAHGSFEKYRDAKLSFLRYAVERGAKVFLNQDDKNAEYFEDMFAGTKISLYSKNDTLSSRLGLPGTPLGHAAGTRVGSEGFFPSDFNKENVAAAVALAKDLGIDDSVIVKALSGFSGVPGRMEFVQREPFAVVVDYAHTPDSLEAVYRALRAHMAYSEGHMAYEKAKSREPSAMHHRLICVLGSAGGGRDKWKRPEMGKIAANYCDAIVFTNEDPYDEDPELILADIENGARENPRFRSGQLSSMTWRILDRREAIRTAVSVAGAGDIVVITGKGSEPRIHLAQRKHISWDERKTVENILAEKK